VNESLILIVSLLALLIAIRALTGDIFERVRNIKREGWDNLSIIILNRSNGLMGELEFLKQIDERLEELSDDLWFSGQSLPIKKHIINHLWKRTRIKALKRLELKETRRLAGLFRKRFESLDIIYWKK
jgi:hypothetical protein